MGFGIYLLTLIPPLLVVAISAFVFKRTITKYETIAQILVVLTISLITLIISYPSPITVNEIINGQVTSKERKKVSCEHSYNCNCHQVSHTSTDSNGNSSTYYTTECDTCYEHSYDVDWLVYSNLDKQNSLWSSTTTIERLSERGLEEPPRWTKVKIGEPFSKTHRYVDYIKSVPESLFNHSELEFKQFAGRIPAYPENIYDYYKIDRVLSIGVPLLDIRNWNDYLSERLKTIGVKKQANIIIIFVNTSDQTYRYALEAKWVGGRKNDVIVIIGQTTLFKYDWVDTITLGSNAGNSLMTVLMRDRIMALQTHDYKTVIDTISNTVLEKFDRKPMASYKSLEKRIKPVEGIIPFTLILGLVVSIGLTIFFHKKEVY